MTKPSLLDGSARARASSPATTSRPSWTHALCIFSIREQETGSTTPRKETTSEANVGYRARAGRGVGRRGRLRQQERFQGNERRRRRPAHAGEQGRVRLRLDRRRVDRRRAEVVP